MIPGKWDILAAVVIDPKLDRFRDGARTLEQLRAAYPDAEIRTFPRTVRAGGAKVVVRVIVARKRRVQLDDVARVIPTANPTSPLLWPAGTPAGARYE